MSNIEFTDEDLDEIEKETHEHSYVETLDSKDNGVRIFKCTGCGFIRKIWIKGSGVRKEAIR
jgi:hypothetical protein